MTTGSIDFSEVSKLFGELVSDFLKGDKADAENVLTELTNEFKSVIGSYSGGTGTTYELASYTGSGTLSGSEAAKAKQIATYLKQRDPSLTDVQISGIVGNMMQESSLDPSELNSGEGAVGLCQWEGSRRVALENFANTPAEQGKPSWEVQCDFMLKELNSGRMGSNFWNASTPQQAALAFAEDFEGCTSGSYGARESNAATVYNELFGSVSA